MVVVDVERGLPHREVILKTQSIELCNLFCKNLCAKIYARIMGTADNEQALGAFGKRVQRCYGCFVAYHLKDMYLGEDATFFCEHCKDETMFHFEDFSKLMDLSKLNDPNHDHHH